MKTFLDKLFKGIDYFTGILTGLMVLFVFLNVVLRIVFNSGLTWSEELSRYLFVFVTYIGAISAMRAGGHMTVDMLTSKVSPRLQMILYVISQSLIAVLMAILVHGSIKMVVQNVASRTAALGISYALLYSAGIITGVSIAILAIANIAHADGLPGFCSQILVGHHVPRCGRNGILVDDDSREHPGDGHHVSQSLPRQPDPADAGHLHSGSAGWHLDGRYTDDYDPAPCSAARDQGRRHRPRVLWRRLHYRHSHGPADSAGRYGTERCVQRRPY